MGTKIDPHAPLVNDAATHFATQRLCFIERDGEKPDDGSEPRKLRILQQWWSPMDASTHEGEWLDVPLATE